MNRRSEANASCNWKLHLALLGLMDLWICHSRYIDLTPSGWEPDGILAPHQVDVMVTHLPID